MIIDNKSTTLVNYRNDNPSLIDLFYSQPTELTDNLFYAIKNNVLIDYSLANIKKSDVSNEYEKRNTEK